MAEKNWVKGLAESWGKWTPPDRPSPGELAVYAEALGGILKRKKKPAILVLGSTSEFRDLAAQYKLPCTVIEYNTENYNALGSLMKRKPLKETLVVGDWRTIKLKQKFDLILGDFCVNVLPKKDQPQFIKNVANLLAPRGFCMLKTFVRYDEVRGDLAERLAFYRTKMKHRPILETVMATMFKSAYNYQTEELTFPAIWQNFTRLYKAGKMKKDEYAYFESLHFNDIPLRAYIPLLTDILAVIKEQGQIYGVRYSGEWFSFDVPIVIFKR